MRGQGKPITLPVRIQDKELLMELDTGAALSLVGEPIMYPQINTLIDMLHSRAISTFLVTNAQFPTAIRCSAIMVVVPTCIALETCYQ